jgi:hypothetical protein
MQVTAKHTTVSSVSPSLDMTGILHVVAYVRGFLDKQSCVALVASFCITSPAKRANPDVSSALDYYRVTVYNAFLDCLIQRTARGSIQAMMLSALFPRYAIDACFEDVREGCVLFSRLIILMGQYLTYVDIEFESWQLVCGALKDNN